MNCYQLASLKNQMNQVDSQIRQQNLEEQAYVNTSTYQTIL